MPATGRVDANAFLTDITRYRAMACGAIYRWQIIWWMLPISGANGYFGAVKPVITHMSVYYFRAFTPKSRHSIPRLLCNARSGCEQERMGFGTACFTSRSANLRPRSVVSRNSSRLLRVRHPTVNLRASRSRPPGPLKSVCGDHSATRALGNPAGHTWVPL